MANKKNVEANKKNTEIKNKKSNELEQKKPTQKKKRRLHSHLKVNIPLFQSLMMILPSLAKHAAAESIDNSSDAADQVTANNVTEKDVTDDHSKADSSAVALQEAQTSDNDVNSTLSASHAAHGSSSHLVPSHHLSTLSHPQVHYIPSVSMPTISSGSNGQPTHLNAPTAPALPVTFIPEVIKGTYGELHVDANGQYTFVLNPKSPQYILLNQHQQGTDHFLLHLSNGSSVIVQVPVTGKQDTPSISGDLTGVVTEDHNIDSQGLLHANGKIDVIDPDQSESSVTPEVISGKYGSLTIDADGHWQYQVDNSLSNVQALTAATSLHESFTIHTKDGTPQTIDMTIGGNDDNAVITGVDAGTVTEDLTTQVQGQLSVTDSDLGEDHFQASQVTSSFGTLSITKDGAWTYDLDNNNPVVQGLGQGSTATDIVTVHSADGTAHQVTVTINGTNDKAIIGGTNSGAVTEESQLQTSGTLTVTDVDTGEAHFSNTDIVGNLGTLHLTDSGAWTYDLDNTNPIVQALGANKTATDTITVHSADGTTHQVTITINGTNDKAIIGGTSSGAVTEESQLQTSGTLTVTDIDTGEAHFSNTDIVGNLGTLHLTDSGAWTYDLDNTNPTVQALGVNKTATDTIAVHSADGTPHQVTITVNGTNDKAIIGGTNSGAVTEESQLQTSGTLTVTDVDTGEAHFSNTDIVGNLGTLHLTDSGAWTYDLDNTNPIVQALGANKTATDTITVHSADGTTHQVTITINGTNDKAIIGGTSSGAVTEESQLQTSGTLTVTDIDTGEAHFSNTDIVGNLGTLHLTDSGAWTYDLDNTNPTVQALGVNKTATDTIAVHSADGTPHQVTITVNGTNDKAIIGGTNSGSVTEESQLQTSGTLTVTDVDTGEAHFSNTDIVGNLGTLHLTDSGAWTYDLDNTNPIVQALGVNKTATDTIAVHSADGTPHQVTITVNGTNDKAIIGGTSSGSVTEESQLQTSGTLTVTDVDTGGAHFSNTDVAGSLGTLHLTDSGTWTYDLDNTNPTVQALRKGVTATDTITIHSADGTPHQVTITVNGTNDAALIGGTNSGAVTEESQLQTSGTLTVTDIDTGEAHFSNTDIVGNLGTLHLTDSGAWTYDLDNTNPIVQALGVNKTATDTITVHSADGTPHQVTITVNGTNDTAVIGGTNSGAVTEESQLQTSGTLTVTDVDTGEAHFSNTDVAGSLGTLHLTDSGAWTYDLDNTNPTVQALGKGATATDTITVHSADGTSHQVTITVNGTNDTAVIMGTSTGDVHEGHTFTAPDGSMTGGYVDDRSPDHQHGNIGKLWNDEIHTDGHLSVVDADAGESYAQTGTYYGTHGRVILQTNGDWTYYASIGQDATGRAIDHLGKGESLTDTVTVRSADGTTHDIVVTIHGDNDRPYCSSEVQLNSGKEDLAQTLTATELLANTIDVDTNDLGKLTITNLHADHGSILDNQDGTFTFTPTKDYNGQVHFTYDVTDAHGGITATGANLHLQATGDAATITGIDQGNVTEDRGYIDTQYNLHFDGKLDIVDPDQGEAQFDIQRGHTYHGIGYDTKMGGWVLLQQDGTYTYTIDNRKPEIQNLGSTETLVDKVTIHSVDGTSHEIQITIHGTNDDPKVSSVTTLPAGTEDTDVVLHASDLLANATDIDHNDAGQLLVANLTADHGKITDNHDGTFTFHPALDYNGKVSFSYDVKDAHAGSTATSASMTLAPTSDAAVITGSGSGVKEDINVDISSGHLLGASGVLHVVDPDGPAQSQFPDVLYGGIYQGSHGGDLQVNSNGNYYYHISNYLVQHLSEGETLKEEYTIHSVDGTQHKVEFTVEGTNDKPVLSAQSQSVTEGGTLLSGQMHATDVDTKDTHTFTIDKPVDGLTFNNDGSYTFDPSHASYQNLGVNNDQVIHVQVKVDDHNGGTDTKTLTLVVHGTNDSATIGGQDTFTVQEDHNLTLNSGNTIIYNGQLTITDADAGEDHFDGNLHQNQQTGTWDTGYTTQEGGKLILQPNGSYRYEIDNSLAKIQSLGSSETLIDTVTVRSADGTPHQIQVTIQGDNDAPVVSSAVTLTAGTEDIDVVLHASDLLANATDIDHNDAGKLSVANLIADHGKITDNHDGTFTFHPNQDYNGKVSFTYDVQDAHGGSVATSASITLTPTRDSAVISGDDTGSIKEDHNVGPSSLHPVAASGLLSVTDPDAGQDHFQVNLLLGEQAIHDPFGGFLRITPSGAWGYEVANSRLQSLAEGEVEKVVYRVYSADHTAHDITITVTGTNDQPTITATTLAHGTEDTHYQMQSSQFGFSDIDTGDTLHSIAITDLPPATQGKFVLDGHDVTAGQHIPTADISKLQFVPAQDFNGDVQFKYTVNDGHTDSAEATNTLHIDAVGDKAVISGVDTGDVYENRNPDMSPDFAQSGMAHLTNSMIHVEGQLTIIDPDTGENSFDSKGIGYTYHGKYGHLILNTDGKWFYGVATGTADVNGGLTTKVGSTIDQLGANETLTDTITIQSKDGTTHDIVITIHGDNDRPYCSSEVQLNSGKEDLAQTITTTELLANTVDVDTNDAGQLTIANLYADHGTLVDNKDGTFTFTPNHNFNGKVHFTYDVKDAHGGVTHTGASATLLPSNDAATLQPTLASNFVTEDHLKSGTNTNELWSGWKNLDIQDIDSQPEAKVTQIEVNGVKHTVPANFAMNLAGTHGTFNFTHSTDGHDKWSYSADNSHAEVQSLSHGDSLTDTITLITADGTRIPLTAKILGTDDHVIIDTPDALTAALGTAVEDKVTSISGTLLAHDSDSKDSVTFTAGNSVGAYGTLHVDSNGQWHYDLDHSKANALQQGETKAEGFDITAISTDGSTATKHIEVLVQGNDDGAIISGQDSGQVTEDKHLQTSGNLTVTDPDSGEGHFTATSGSTQLGTYTIDASGHWTYSLDPRVQSLHQGETTPDVFTVHSADGTAHVIKVTITGTQDAPIITGQSTGAVYEDSQTSVSGTLNADDKDYGQSGFWAQSHIASTHNFGDLSIDRNGHWTFHLNPTNTAVNALGEHDTLLETVTVNTIDGTSKEIQITIHGTNDGAIISGGDTGSVTEDKFTGMQWLITKGQLTISDADTGEDKFDSMVHAQNNAGIGYDTKLGGHVLLSEDGSWQYNMDNFSPAVQKLAEGETAIDTVTIHSVDGTSHEIQVTITGTNDAPILGVNQTSSTTGTLTEADVDVNDTHTFSIVSSTGQFGSLSVDPNTGDYVYTPNTSITGMSYNSATNSYHGVDVFEVKVSDGHTEDSKFITFDASGHVTMSPTGGLVISTTVPQQPTVTTTLPTLLMVTNVAPTNSVTLDLASTSDSGSSNTDNLTNDTTPTITGHTDIPFSKVTIYDGSTPVGHSVSDASGQYSVSVSSLSHGDHNLSAKALAPSSVLPATSSLLSVHIDTQVHIGIQTNPITADNVINAQESNSSIDITGSVSGDYNAGDIVTLDVNGTQHTGVVDAKGHYSIAVPGSELIADADQKIEASVAVTDSAGNSAHATADVTYQVDTQVSVPTITFENAGADNLYSKAEIARGQANTITATVTPPGDAKIGEHLVVNGQDHVLDAHTLQHGIQIEVHPGSNVQATMTDEHGNTAGSQGFAASAIPEPIIVRPPSGSHQVSGTLGVPPLLPSLTPVPTAQSGWRIHLPNGQYVTSHHGQYGTLTIDPQTGHLHYQEQAQVHTGPHGSASGIGQHEDKFEVALQGTNQDEVVAHVNIQILSHGPGHSGKLTVGTEVVDMTITPLVHTSHPAPPPPPPVQHDEPDMASQADFTVTLSDDSNRDLTLQTHQEPDQKTSHHGAAAYLDALGIKPDSTSTTAHDQPADMDIVLAQVDQPDAVTHDQAHLDMSDALEHHDANINHNQDDEHHHHNDVDGLPDIDPNS
ncbi:VCBS domain-containing protein [Vibrio crassostreae]|uniref:VCBS domain-containing protein n=1 Tax=Vibrio crassostreae TaxID=246167 RepID=UPI00200A5E18|nr:VCBS domain-containing protein [Vibrio crassostreae]